MSNNLGKLMGFATMAVAVSLQLWMLRVKGTTKETPKRVKPFLQSIKNIEVDLHGCGHWAKYVPNVINSQYGSLQMQCINCIICGNYNRVGCVGFPDTNSPHFEFNKITTPNIWCVCCDDEEYNYNDEYDDHEYKDEYKDEYDYDCEEHYEP
jgi:hypothetical protein